MTTVDAASPEGDRRIPGGRLERSAGATERPPWFVQAKTPREFRAMLSALKDKSGMSFGQLASRAGWSRSGLHKATIDGHTLPARQLVNDFIIACRVSPVQADLVMEIWEKISEAAKAEEDYAGQHTAPTAAKHTVNSPVPSDARPHPVLLATPSMPASLEHILKELRDAHADSSGSDLHVHVVQQQNADNSRNQTTLVDLLHFILLDQRRTQRALQLMAVVGGLAALQIVLVVVLVAHVPSGGLWLGVTAMAGVTVLTIRRLARKLAQASRARQHRALQQPGEPGEDMTADATSDVAMAMAAAAPVRRRGRQNHRSNATDTQKLSDRLQQSKGNNASNRTPEAPSLGPARHGLNRKG